MGSALAELTHVGELEALAAYVRAAADHPQVAVAAGGILDAERDGHAAGTLYVVVTVPTVDAAELAEHLLSEIARIDGATWQSGWRLIDGPALAIDIYPDADADQAHAFVTCEGAARDRRRPELGALVRDALVSAPDVGIADSGTDADERGFVDIRVISADGADRAEHALAAVAELATSWRLDGNALLTRVYL